MPRSRWGAERRALFLSETRAVALESRDGGERLLYTEDGARRWQAATIMEQVWPDAGAYGKAFDAQAERTRGLGQADRLEYRWSLYPLGETQAVGWSWRVRVQTGAQAPQLIETRRFEIAFQDGAPPAFRIQQAAAPAPFQTRQAHPVLTPAARCARRRAARSISWTRRPGNGMAWPPRPCCGHAQSYRPGLVRARGLDGAGLRRAAVLARRRHLRLFPYP